MCISLVLNTPLFKGNLIISNGLAPSDGSVAASFFRVAEMMCENRIIWKDSVGKEGDILYASFKMNFFLQSCCFCTLSTKSSCLNIKLPFSLVKVF